MSDLDTAQAMLEVEQKYRVDGFESVVEKLAMLGAQSMGTRRERDTYFAHPMRSFAETDEALRVRFIDGSPVVTYKGPRAPGAVKIRREIELDIAGGSAAMDDIVSMLEALGFGVVANVVKSRSTFRLQVDGHSVTITLDDVNDVPPHVEVEVISTDATSAANCVARVSEQLGLTADRLESRSYLELVLER